MVNLEDPRRFPAFNAFAEFIAVPLVFLLLAIPLLSGWLLWRLPEGKWRPALALFLALGSLLLIALEILSSGGC
ncbi:MAG: hypothetical protein EOP50_13020 [Sphingobacteriales bacterium]|nr:MAG: hypothetical protein EOP50_13020 [Sphingobacteriales bacterium]